MSSVALKRLMKDHQSLQTDPPYGISAEPIEDNYFCWQAIIIGPKDTPYEDGFFKLKIHFPKDYPNKPPEIRFVSDIFHPNVYPLTGVICLDILRDKWLPILEVSTILSSIQSLLSDPNVESPANNSAAHLYKMDMSLYKKKVRECVKKSLEN